MKLSIKIILSIGLLFILIGQFVGISFYNGWMQSIRKIVAERQHEDAVQTLDKIDKLLYERLIDVQVIAILQGTTDILTGKSSTNEQNLSRWLSDFSNLTGYWETVDVVDLNNKIVSSTEKSRIGSLISNPNIQSLVTAIYADGKPYSDVYVFDGGKPTMYFGAQVINKNIIGNPSLGVVIGHFSWPVIQEILDDSKASHVNLVNSVGLEIASNHEDPDKPNLYANYKDTKQFQSAIHNYSGSELLPDLETGSPSFISYVHESGYLDFHGNNWIAFFQTPTSEINSMMLEASKFPFMILLFVILLGMGIIILVIQVILINPIQMLSSMTKKIASGDLNTKSQYNSNDELGQLSQSFEGMSNRIRESSEILDTLVRRRTAELEDQMRAYAQKTAEMEHVNKMMIGREVRMAEMKKELEELKNKIGT